MCKSILVTGAYGGMGRAVTEALSNRGFRVFALDRKADESQRSENGKIIPVEADITDAQSVNAAFSRISNETDELFAIIHFAGIYMLDSLVEMEDEDFERIFKINLGGAFLINKTFLPLLRRGSRILITTSELAPLDPLPFTGIYAVTKGALDKYAYSLRMELQLKGIYVSVLRAGAVETGMIDASLAALDGFYKKTKIYTCNAQRFLAIVNKVESRSISPDKLAKRAVFILCKGRPKFAYSINRNPLLLALNILPRRMQFWIIKKVLEDKRGAKNGK